MTPLAVAPTFFGEASRRARREKMAIRSKFALLLCALLGGLFFLAGAPNVASAHPGHNHVRALAAAPSPSRISVGHEPARRIRQQGALLQSRVVKRSVQNGVAVRLAPAPPKPPQPLHAGNCCCGSIACHAGVEAPTVPLLAWCSLSQKFDLPAVLPMPKSVWGGIERPPRCAIAL